MELIQLKFLYLKLSVSLNLMDGDYSESMGFIFIFNPS
jgi:hypothetical protein